MKKSSCHVHVFDRRMFVVYVLVAAAYVGTVLAQDRSNQNQSSYDRTKAVPEASSRAQQEADRLVSLSADRIISLLVDEPGLFLECKKLLVRTAYKQGRLLDPEDLTDDSVFRQVREDENVRVLFTREIEDRLYVRAKPTREELDRQREEGHIQLPDVTTAQAASAVMPTAKSREDAYWLRHERDLEPSVSRSGVPAPGSTTPESGAPIYTPSPSDQMPGSTGPQPYVPLDSRRSLLQAQQSQDDFDFGSEDGTGMPSLSADQMSRLVDARTNMGGRFAGGSSSGDSLSPMSRGLDMPGAMGGGIGMPGFDALSMGSLAGLGSSPDLSGIGASPSQGAARGNNALYPPYYRYPQRRLDLKEKQPALRRRANPYADVPSLYDLYAQYSRRTPKLDRFGIDIFQNGTGNFDQLPMDMPVGPDYVLGPGDGLSINLFGGVSQRLRRVVDREGRVVLPEVGGVQVSGRTLGDVQQMVQSVMRTEYRDVQADISLARLRSVRVYVVGDVQSPGAYEVSSLSTALNAVYEAGGPTSGGSLRILNHYRGKQLIQRIDVYDLLLHGVNAGMQRLESGDTIQVPPLGPEVTVRGMVRRPAIYELNGEKTLAEVLQIAGGVLPTGTLRNVDVERLEAHESKTMLRLDIPENNNQAEITKALDDFQIQDGDKIQISPILPYADKTVYLDGYVFRPGKFAYRDGMKVTDLIKSYKDLLPEPYKQHAEIIRLKSPDNTPEVLAFNLDDALAGKDQDLVLQPFDTVRVFGRYDFEDPPIVTVTGEVRDPGDHVTNGVTHLRDAIYMAGGVSADAQLDDVQVFRKNQDGRLEVISSNLRKALAGDPKDDILLETKDRVFVHRNLAKVDPATVIVQGEVGRPGKYPLGNDMTAADLVRFAGGLKRSAYAQEADLTSYTVENGSKVVGDHRTVEIAKALAGEPDTDVRLHDGDVLTIRQLAGWNDLGATITVKGEVMHPGTYGIQEGERLSSILQRAGGFRADAYPYGTVFQRAQVRDMEEQNRDELIRRVKGEEADVKLTAGADEEIKQATLLQYQTTLERLQNTPPLGRLVIHISSNLKRWTNTPADIQVRAGDIIYIPKRSNMVIVDGSVYNPTAITFKPGKNAGWYLNQAGGPTQLANKKGVFVVRGDGSVVGGPGGLFSGGVEKAELQPGDMVVVPEKTFSVSRKFQNTVQAAQIFAAIGVAAQSAFYLTK
ncbi:MAG: SLBB domain-containing protein [Acidobacteriia bacterium]|nr:SLBB domain-containing protein [Terriglobia bacterium]